jgi:polyisoprenoid-binding protein YceI
MSIAARLRADAHSQSTHIPVASTLRYGKGPYHIMLFRSLAAALFIVCAGCTPVAVLTHHVNPRPLEVPAGQYQLDHDHWSVLFDVDHLQYSHFVMRFDKVTAQLDVGRSGLDSAHVSAMIDASSVDTNVPQLNRLVSGSQMFDAARNPTIRFDGAGWQPTGDHDGTLTGALTVRGVTRPVTLHVAFNGAAPDPLTKLDKLGFSAEGTFKRSDFGLTTWYPAVGDEVRVRIQAEFVKPPSQG